MFTLFSPVMAPWGDGAQMPSAGSVTGWIVGLKAGEREAVQKLWERYFARLVRLARAVARLARVSRRRRRPGILRLAV